MVVREVEYDSDVIGMYLIDAAMLNGNGEGVVGMHPLTRALQLTPPRPLPTTLLPIRMLSHRQSVLTHLAPRRN